MLKFLYNGIKGVDGKLQKCTYSDGPFTRFPAGTITIYAKNYTRFSVEVAQAFHVENNSDSQTDYFETDKLRVVPFHPLYGAVKSALAAAEAKNDRRYLKYLEKQQARAQA